MSDERDPVADAVREMTMHEGWNHVTKYIRSRIADCENQLIESCKPEDVEKLRAQRDCLRGVLIHVEELQNPDN